MRNFLFVNIILLLSSLLFLGWGEEVVLYTGTLLFVTIGLYLIKNNLFLFYMEKKVELEKEYFVVFFIKSSKIREVIKKLYGIEVIERFYLTVLLFLEERLKRLTTREVFEKCGLIYM